MPNVDYHLRQAEVASRLALAESRLLRAVQLHLLALEHFDKADAAKAQSRAMPAGPRWTARRCRTLAMLKLIRITSEWRPDESGHRYPLRGRGRAQAAGRPGCFDGSPV